MNRMLIYPISETLMPLLRYGHLHPYEICAALAPKGWGCNGRDAAVMDGGPDTGIRIQNDFAAALPDCDIVLLDDDGLTESPLAHMLLLTKQANKKCLLTKGAADKLTLTMQVEEVLEYPPPIGFPRPQKIRKIPVPVIMVMGLGEQCQKFELQLALREYFIQQGYKVSQLGTKSYSKLFGFDPLPNVFGLSFEDKIFELNQHMIALVDREKPDLLIVDIPGGIMPLNEYHSLHFGEMALALTHAATPDATVLSIYQCNANAEYLDTLEHFCRYRFGTIAENFHMSNTMIYFNPDRLDQYQLIKTGEDIQFLPACAAMLREGDRLYTLQRPDSMQKMLVNLCQELQDNLDVV